MSNRIFQLVCALLVTTAAFGQKDASKAKVLDPANMDLTVKPGDDFMQYAGGTWI